MGLLPHGRTREVERRGAFRGPRPARFPTRELRDLRGNRLAMIFQEPMTSLNPAYTIGDQIVEALAAPSRASSEPRRATRAIEMLRRVRIPSPEKRIDDYPHKLSGGMRQRVMIAMALACDPQLLIADEPTTALDVTIQAQILDLMRDLQRETGTAIILITHDLGVVAEMCDEVAVMYAGEIVERAPVEALFARPAASLHGRACWARSRGSTDAPSACHRSKAACPTWRIRRTAAASPRAARSSSRPAAPRRRRSSKSAPGHLSRCRRAPLDAGCCR